MSSTSISTSSFSMSQIDEHHHLLNIHFFDGSGIELSKHTFIFQQVHPIGDGAIVDLFTKNGSCSQSSIKRLIKNLFNDDDLSIAETISTKTLSPTGLKICVFDLKHHAHGYADKGYKAIKKSEKKLLAFLKKEADPTDQISETAQKIQSLFHETLPLDFIIFEGRLKT